MSRIRVIAVSEAQVIVPGFRVEGVIGRHGTLY
jgi:hypothetical protein